MSWPYVSENWRHINLTTSVFSTYHGKFLPYLFISIHGRTLLTFMLLLTCLIMPINNVITQTIFVVLFISGSLLTCGKPLDASSSVSPMYLSATYSQLTTSLFYRHHMMTDYAFFSQGLDRWGKDLALLWGCLMILPPLQQFHISSITQSELSSLTSLKAWGEKQKVHHDITFLLVLAEEEAMGTGGMVFWPYGWTLVRPGSALWRKQLGNWLPGSSADPISPMPWCS